MQTRRVLALGQKGAKNFLEHYGQASEIDVQE
jgi:hypothetical protein